MRTAALLLALLLQAPAPEVETTEPPPVFAGTPEEGLRELVQRSLEDDHEEARRMAAALLVRELPDAWRAEVSFADGVARHRARENAEAAEAFLMAGALAGPGELRRDAWYDAGGAHLDTGEEWFAKIPEVQAERGQAPGAAPPAGPVGPLPGGAPGATGEEEPDPLAEARAAYGRAKELLGERLRLDWRDADTRANLELIQRRLRRLDEIEKEREEQQPEDPPPSEEDSEDQETEQDPNAEDSPEDSEDGDNQDSEEPPDSENPPDEETPPDEPSDPSEEEPEPSEPEEPEDSGDEEEAPADEEPQEPGPETEVPLAPLTPEEMSRLYDKLEHIEEQANVLWQALKESRRQRVLRDW